MIKKHFRLICLLIVLLVLIGSNLPTARQVHAAIIIVDSAADNLTAGDNLCTLREAIMNANAGGDTSSGDCIAGVVGADTITFASSLNGVSITLTLSGAGEDANLTGDLDITDIVTITGNGVGKTIIDASGLGDRVFHIPGGTTVEMNDLTIKGGTALSSSRGGGILNFGNLTLNRVRVTENSSDERGGGLYFANGTSQINDSLIDANIAATSGGGVFLDGGSVTVVVTLNNSTLSGNSAAGFGGGLITLGPGATAILNHVTAANNQADSDNTGGETGGGISNLPVFAGTLNIRNTLVADNFLGSSNPGYDCSGTISSLDYNHIEDTGGCGFITGTGDVVAVDPILGALTNNGGPTFTHALGSGSIAINTIPAGVNGCGTTYTADQRGVSRPQGSNCDKGAYEFVTAVVPGVNGGDGPGGVGLTNGSSSMELWLKADRGVFSDVGCTTPASSGNDVACWQDQSGNGWSYTQATSGNRPNFLTAVQNNQPVIRFNGTSDYLSSGAVLAAGDDTFTYFAGWMANTAGTHVIFEQNSATQMTGERAALVTIPSATYGFSGEGNDFTNVVSYTVGQYEISAMVLNGNPTADNVLVYGRGTAYTGTINIGTQNLGTTGGTAVGHKIPTNGEFHDGDIGEIVVFSNALNDTQRILVENYLSAKYDVALNANDVYDGDTSGSGDFDLNVAGIGRLGGNNHTQAHAAGMIVVNRTFLQDNGDWLLFGHRTLTNSSTSNDVPTSGDWATATNPRRWQRHFYIDVTDVGTTGGTVDIIFDYSEGGMDGNPGGLPDGLVSNYRLLKRTGTSGVFTDIATATAIVGDQVHFQGVDVALLGSNFTLGTLNVVDSPTAVTFQSLAAPAVDTAVVPLLTALILLAGITAVFLSHSWQRQKELQ
ncbi:MAG: hypothetical protein BroJett015_33030 [Chloroflexota bacterium]|nr:hypothetical protein [Ardenticatenaceae bacterium]GIK57640.1 MAG: hypothetical protein BroJett015_33030 [Chloroflexota bacterium]